MDGNMLKKNFAWIFFFASFVNNTTYIRYASAYKVDVNMSNFKRFNKVEGNH